MMGHPSPLKADFTMMDTDLLPQKRILLFMKTEFMLVEQPIEYEADKVSSENHSFFNQ